MVLLEGSIESDRADHAVVPSLHSHCCCHGSATRAMYVACGVWYVHMAYRISILQSENETKDPVSLCGKAELFAI